MTTGRRLSIILLLACLAAGGEEALAQVKEPHITLQSLPNGLQIVQIEGGPTIVTSDRMRISWASLEADPSTPPHISGDSRGIQLRNAESYFGHVPWMNEGTGAFPYPGPEMELPLYSDGTCLFPQGDSSLFPCDFDPLYRPGTDAAALLMRKFYVENLDTMSGAAPSLGLWLQHHGEPYPGSCFWLLPNSSPPPTKWMLITTRYLNAAGETALDQVATPTVLALGLPDEMIYPHHPLFNSKLALAVWSVTSVWDYVDTSHYKWRQDGVTAGVFRADQAGNLYPVKPAIIVRDIVLPSFARWVPTSGPGGGNILSLAVSGTNLFAGTQNGIFLSTNNGTNWAAVNDGLAGEGVWCFAASGANLFAGTTSGVFLSTNNGTYWTAVNAGLANKSVRCLAVSGTNLFASTEGSGVFLSTNNGTSWTAVNDGLGNAVVFSLAVSGTDLFAATWQGGVFRSTNNGSHWTAVNNGLPIASWDRTIYVEISAIAVSGTNLFAGAGEGGVFLSTNNGTSWTAVNDGLAGEGVWCFAASGANLFAGTAGSGVFLSTNNGTHWTAVKDGLTSTLVQSLAVSGTNLFAGTQNGGVFLSTNNGTNWAAVNEGLANTLVQSLLVSGRNLFAGTENGDVFLSTNNGTNWTAVNAGLANKSVRCLAVSGTNLFAGTVRGGVFLSTNNGTSWTAVNDGLGNAVVFSLAVSGMNLFAGTGEGGVFLSTNNGTSWTAVNNGLPIASWAGAGLCDRTIYVGISAIAVGGTNLFAGTQNGIFLSTNNGTNWAAVNDGLAGEGVWCFAASGANLFAGTTSGVFLSTNNGTHWTAVNNGLADTPVHSLAVSGTNLFAGTQNGIFLSTNNGTSWTAVNEGLVVTSWGAPLVVSGTDLFVGEKRGVWRRPLSEMITSSVERSSMDVPAQFGLEQNYPNPFNPKTIVGSQMPVASHVKLAVYNLLGQEVAVLVNERRAAGHYRDAFDASGLSSGVYFYRLQAGEFTQTKKFLLVK